MPRLPSRYLSGLEYALVLVVVAATVAVVLSIHTTVTQVREGLPARVLEQQRDVAYVVHDLADLLHAIDHTRVQRSDVALASARSKVDLALQRLQLVRSTYNFDNLVGASAMHAVVNPALQDVRRWLTEGLQGNAPDSRTVLRLARERTTDAYDRVREIFDDANVAAVELVGVEAARLERLRRSLIVYLGAFALLGAGFVVLFLRQRKAELLADLEHRRLIESIESLSEGFALYDAEDRLLVCNSRYRDLYGGAADAVRPGARFEDVTRAVVDGGPVETVAGARERAIEERLARHREPAGPFEIELADGRSIRVSERRTREGGSVGIHTDVTESKSTEERLKHLATHDPLTGLPNRSHFQDRLEHAISLGRRHRYQVGVMFFDLDRFKLVNDTFGHASGDRLLEKIARALGACLREHDTVARLGGDEFAAILENVSGWRDVTSSAERALAALSRSFQLEEGEVFVTTSIGIAVYPEDGTDIPTLMRNADAACYHAKARGRDNFQFYTAAINARATQRLELEKQLRLALDDETLSLVYQPQVDTLTGRVTGLEALARWSSPALGAVPPAEFIPVAEESGLVVPLGERVLREACARNRAWRDEGLEHVGVAVNLSARQLLQPDLVRVVEAALEAGGLDPAGLTLELTESAIMGSLETARETLRALSDMGVRLAIDDFGTGYSSLAALREFPLHALKIDTSFVRDIVSDKGDLELVSAVIAMGHNLNLGVIAEGVETEEQLALLRKRECDAVQGFIYARPLPAAEVRRFLSPDFRAFPSGGVQAIGP